MNVLKKVDYIDKEIIDILQCDPGVTHSQIARKLDRSQPAIGARIKKLRDYGLISTQIGIDFRKVKDLVFEKVDLIAKFPDKIQTECDKCNYVINTFRTSGDYNLFILMAGDSLKRLDAIIDKNFRDNPTISKVKVEIITNISKKLVLPFNKVIYEEDELSESSDDDDNDEEIDVDSIEDDEEDELTDKNNDDDTTKKKNIFINKEDSRKMINIDNEKLPYV